MLIYKYSQLHDMSIGYKESLQICKNARKLHLGQFKLFFSELLFLSKYAKTGDKILYIGAAPGYHIQKLAEFFPECIFELWDPREFDIKKLDNIIMYQELFTDNIAKKYAIDGSDYLLMCDIRNLDIDKSKKNNNIEEMDNIVCDDMKLQLNWCQIINPRKAYIKFRLPYEIPKYQYLTGTIYLQPYSKISTETRLSTSDYTHLIEYDTLEFEKKMAYHNGHTRCLSYPKNKWSTLIKKYNLYDCWDTVFALYILFQYVSRNIEIIDESKLKENAIVLFLSIIKFHEKKYGKKYNILFDK